MIVCRFMNDYEERFETLEEAIEFAEREEECCCDDEEIAENFYEIKCDLVCTLNGEDGYCEEDEDGNLIFER